MKCANLNCIKSASGRLYNSKGQRVKTSLCGGCRRLNVLEIPLACVDCGRVIISNSTRLKTKCVACRFKAKCKSQRDWYLRKIKDKPKRIPQHERVYEWIRQNGLVSADMILEKFDYTTINSVRSVINLCRDNGYRIESVTAYRVVNTEQTNTGIQA